MTKEIWIGIAQIVIPTVASVLIALWQVRVMRALTNPTQPQPKIIRNVAGQVRHWMNLYGYKIICLGVPVYVITYQLTNESPLTKWSIGVIVVNVFFLNFFLSAWYTIQVARVLLGPAKPKPSTAESESPASPG